MFNFLHTFHPSSIMFSFGPINIYWYGFFIVLGIIAALLVAIKLGSYYGIKKDTIFDLAFYLIILGVIGARVYDMLFVEWSYFIENPLSMFKVWEGGLAIHGAIIAGALTLYFFAKRRNLEFWLLSSILVPGLALAQAIGRWGNYFNQELFGGPTDLPWGIPISIVNRPIEYISSTYFHPAFLYESLGSFVVFTALISLHIILKSNFKFKILNFKLIALSYAILYSILRFFTEFIRIDETPEIFGLRLPQVVSLSVIFCALVFLIFELKKRKTKID